MLKFFKWFFIVFCLVITSSEVLAKEAYDEEIKNSNYVDKKGLITLDLFEDEIKEPETLEEKIKKIIAFGIDINNATEGEKINENFTEVLKKYFPEDTTFELYEKQNLTRKFIRTFRKLKAKYDEIKASYLVPEEPPLIVADKDYDMGYHEDYIEAPVGQVAVITDFKKVLSYGNNPRDIASMEAKRKRDLEAKIKKTKMEELWVKLSKVDWKKTLFGEMPANSPFTDIEGSGAWYSENDVLKVKILSEYSKVDTHDKIKMVFLFRVRSGYFIKASSLDNNPYFKVDFSASRNLNDVKIYYPKLNKITDKEGNTVTAYGGFFSIPFTLKVDNHENDLELNAKISVNLCNKDFECEEIELNPELYLESGEGLNSQYRTYVNKVHNNLPREKNKDLKIMSAISTSLSNGEKILKVDIYNDYSLSGLDVLIESPDGIEFSTPRIAVDGNKVVARASLKDQTLDIVGKEVLITVVAETFYSVRELIKITDVSIFDLNIEKLSIPLIFLAILGGLILNFMPCVFPVLSIKLMSLNKVGAKRVPEVKRSFYLTVLGIVVTFFLLSIILCLVKFFGYSVGWGMQFQNPIFLIFMVFIVSMFISYMLEIQKISTPEWLNRLIFKSKDENSILYFMTGVLAVVMATPCTAPYLGTTIGFALAGSYLDIIVIMMSISIGLSIPYVFFAAFPSLVIYVPKPGDWMKKINALMMLMMFLTLLWLITIYYAQTNGFAAFRLFVYVLIFLFVIWMRHLMNNEIDISIEGDENRHILKRRFRNIALLIIFVLFSISIFDASYNFIKNREEAAKTRELKIDMGLINKHVDEGKIVVVNIQADWCLTCMYNDAAVFSNIYVNRLLEKSNIEVINVDWTNYDKDILNFMEKYGRKGLPFYIIYSKKTPDGFVLPEVLSEAEFIRIINSISN